MSFFPAWPVNAQLRLIVERNVFSKNANGVWETLGLWNLAEAISFNNFFNGFVREFNSSNMYSPNWPISINSIRYSNNQFPDPSDETVKTLLNQNEVVLLLGISGTSGLFNPCANGCSESQNANGQLFWCDGGQEQPNVEERTITRGIIHYAINGINGSGNIIGFPSGCNPCGDLKRTYISVMLHEFGHNCGFPHLNGEARMNGINCSTTRGYLTNDKTFANAVPNWTGGDLTQNPND